MRLARSQETVLNWYSRCSKAIATYAKVEEIIRRGLLRNSDKTSRTELQHEYGRLLALRAPLFREIHEYPKSVEDAANGIEIAGKLGDPVLLSDLLRNRAHIAAVGGQGKLWEHKLNEAEATIQQVSGNLQSQLLYMQMYYRGEGNKRLAYNPHNQLSEGHRAAYAQKAIDSFRDAREGLESQWSDIVLAATVSGHPLLTRVSEAQCFVWIDPGYAETLLWQLRSECEINFPALLDKIDLATVYAGLRLKQKKHEPPPTFDLDARYRRVSQ